jgi:hypothetical protein
MMHNMIYAVKTITRDYSSRKVAYKIWLVLVHKVNVLYLL